MKRIKYKALFTKFSANKTAQLIPEKDVFTETLERYLNREIEAPVVATHDEVVQRIKNKFSF